MPLARAVDDSLRADAYPRGNRPSEFAAEERCHRLVARHACHRSISIVHLPPFGFLGGNVKARSIQDVAAAVRGRRTDLGLNQADLAHRAGVSRKWIYEFEAGKPTAEFGLVLRVIEELGLSLEIGPADDAGASPPSDRRAVDLDAVIDRHRRR